MKRYHFYNQKENSYFTYQMTLRIKKQRMPIIFPQALVQPLPHSQPAVHALCVLLEVQTHRWRLRPPLLSRARRPSSISSESFLFLKVTPTRGKAGSQPAGTHWRVWLSVPEEGSSEGPSGCPRPTGLAGAFTLQTGQHAG